MGNPKPRIEDRSEVLVVEGYSDLVFYNVMLEKIGIPDKVFIHDIKGKNGLNEKLEVFVTPSLLEKKSSLAFILDADTNPTGTRIGCEQLLSRITRQNVKNGQWTTGRPRIGLMIVPGGNEQGEIETLVWKSWGSDPKNIGQKRCIEDYIACMKSTGAAAKSQDKGLIGALLAVKSDEDPRLGPGARTNVFDLKRPDLPPLLQFLAGF